MTYFENLFLIIGELNPFTFIDTTQLYHIIYVSQYYLNFIVFLHVVCFPRFLNFSFGI